MCGYGCAYVTSQRWSVLRVHLKNLSFWSFTVLELAKKARHSVPWDPGSSNLCSPVLRLQSWVTSPCVFFNVVSTYIFMFLWQEFCQLRYLPCSLLVKFLMAKVNVPLGISKWSFVRFLSLISSVFSGEFSSREVELIYLYS